MRITEPVAPVMTIDTLVVVAAEVVAPYSLSILFSNGECRLVDFGSFLQQAAHPAIRAYLDENRFRQFEISNGNVNWNDYDLIFPVADLYDGKIC